MRRPRRRSGLGWLLEIPLRLVFAIAMLIVRVIILVRRFLPASLLLLLCALLPLLVSFGQLDADNLGSYIMIAAALILAFAAGALRGR